MNNVQLAIRDTDYAQSLRSLLLRDGRHKVHLVEKPDLKLAGVVVIDENKFECLTMFAEPERFVLVMRKGVENLNRVWNAGIRHVVFKQDSPGTAQMAVIAAELRMPKTASPEVRLNTGAQNAPHQGL
jgi:hypothetical protein